MKNYKQLYRETIFGFGLISLIFRFGEISNYFWSDGGKFGLLIGFFLVGYALYTIKKD